METNSNAEPEAPAAESTAPAENPAQEIPAASEAESAPPHIEAQPAEEAPAASDQAEDATEDRAAQPDADAPSEGSADDATVEAPADPLTALADQALRGRLSPADEERATNLLKAALVDGRTGINTAIEQLPKLPWVIGVNAVGATWLEIKPTLRTRLVAGLARIDSDAARRVRLSLARGLFKQDVPAALKIAVSVAKEIRDKQSGVITPRNAQIFANVLIGRAKPWIGLMPLAELKPAEADLLVHCALVAVFSLPHAPVTQLGVLRWASEAGRLGKLHPVALEAVVKTVGRWSGKWQGALRREVPELPEEIAAVLKPGPSSAEARPHTDVEADDTAPSEPETDEGSKDAAQPPEPRSSRRSRERGGRGERRERREEEENDREEDAAASEEDADREEAADDAASSDMPVAEAPAPKSRPVYESKTVPSQTKRGGAPAHFNLVETLRQIESHVAGLRAELHTAQTKLRQRDDTRRDRRPERSAGPIIPGDPTLEELARLNLQLEARNAELQSRIEELTVDSEDRAAAARLAAPTDEAAPPSPDAQLRTLLGFKLQEDFADFLALEKEAPDIVVQQHYRTVLRHVFEVLRQEGVTLMEESATAS